MYKKIYRAYIYRPYKHLLSFLNAHSVKNKLRKVDKELKIVIGSGGTNFKNWISTDVDILDITKHNDWDKLFSSKKIKNIVAEHVFEHLTYTQTKKSLGLIYNYLEKGGVLRIAVPDGHHPSKYVKDLIKPNGLDIGSDDHKIIWNCDNLGKLAKEIGFKVELQEYFDRKGVFHSRKMSNSHGYISRSAFTYKGRFTDSKDEYLKMLITTPRRLRTQFIEKGISYSSLIIDCKKV